MVFPMNGTKKEMRDKIHAIFNGEDVLLKLKSTNHHSIHKSNIEEWEHKIPENSEYDWYFDSRESRDMCELVLYELIVKYKKTSIVRYCVRHENGKTYQL